MKRCIYPGCERPAVPAAPAGGSAASFCDLEEHNALTAHLERQRLARERRRPEASRPDQERGGLSVADEAYRAVFLRVHPTGKMVLSLTTEADGKEPEYAQLVADELGVPPLDVKVVPADTDRFGSGHGFNTSPSRRHLGGGHQRHRQDPRQGALLAGVALDAPADSLRWDNGAFVAERRPRAASRRSPTSRCTPTAAARCRRASRAVSTPRRCTATEPTRPALSCPSIPTCDLVGDLQRPEQGAVRLDAPVGLLDRRGRR